MEVINITLIPLQIIYLKHNHFLYLANNLFSGSTNTNTKTGTNLFGGGGNTGGLGNTGISNTGIGNTGTTSNNLFGSSNTGNSSNLFNSTSTGIY